MACVGDRGEVLSVPDLDFPGLAAAGLATGFFADFSPLAAAIISATLISPGFSPELADADTPLAVDSSTSVDSLAATGSAVDAADSIHSDLARGFIRAEVTPCDKLLELGGEKEVKAAGLWHIEGKDYVVQDGDELFIRSGV